MSNINYSQIVSCVYRNCVGGNITPRYQPCALLYSVHMTVYNQINRKCLRVPLIYFYILVIFQTRRHFRAKLSVRVSDSVQRVNCAREYRMNKLCSKLHRFIPSSITHHYTLLHNPETLNMNNFL